MKFVRPETMLPLMFLLSGCGYKTAHPPVAKTVMRVVVPTFTQSVKTLEPFRTWTAHSSTVWAVNYSLNGTRLVTAGQDGNICEWDAVSGVRIRQFKAIGTAIYSSSLAYSTDGRFFAATETDGSQSGRLVTVVRVRDAVTGRVLRTLRGNEGQSFLRFTYDNKFLIAGGQDGLTAWRTAGWRVEYRRSDTLYAPPATGGAKYVLAHGKQLGIYEDGPGDIPRLVRLLPSIKAESVSPSEIALAPDGRTVALSSRRQVKMREFGNVITTAQPVAELYDTSTGRRLRVLGPPADANMAFSPDGNALATRSFDTGDRSDRLAIWSIHTGQFRRVPERYTDAVLSVAFSPDGKTLATGSPSGEVSLWHVPQW